MQSLQRSTVRSAGRLRQRVPHQSRRFESHGSHGAHDSHHAAPANESYGTGFYIAIATIPAAFALYKFAGPGTDELPYFTRYIRDTYAEYATKWARRNDLHTQAVEQAAADRVLFLNESTQSIRRVDLRFPEQFNIGSPWNVPAGQGGGNIDEVIVKYEKEAFAANERKLQQLQENKVPREQPVEPLTKMPAATPSA